MQMIGRAVVMSHTVFFFGSSPALGLACMSLMVLVGCGWLVASSFVGCMAGICVAQLYGCMPTASASSAGGKNGIPIDSGVLTFNAVLASFIIGAESTAAAETEIAATEWWARRAQQLIVAALVSALSTWLGLVGQAVTTGRLQLGSLPALVALRIWGVFGPSPSMFWLRTTTSHMPGDTYVAHFVTWLDNGASTLAEMTHFESVLMPMRKSALTYVEMPQFVGGAIADGVAGFGFMPPGAAIPLTLVLLLGAPLDVAFGLWVGCAAGLVGKEIYNFADNLSNIEFLNGSDSTIPREFSLAGVNGVLAFLSVHCLFFGRRRSIWALFVATAIALAAGACSEATGVVSGTWPSALLVCLTFNSV